MATYPYGDDRKTEQKSRAESILNCGGAVKRASGGRVKTNGDTTISITVQPPAAADKPNPLAALAAMAPPGGPSAPPPGAGPGGPGAPPMPSMMGGPGAGGLGMRKGGRARMKDGGAATDAVGLKTGGRARKAFGGPMMDPNAPVTIAPTPRPPSVMNPVVPNVPPAVQAAQQPLTQGFMARKRGGIVKKAGGGVGSPGVTPRMTEGAGGGLGRLKKARDARAG